MFTIQCRDVVDDTGHKHASDGKFTKGGGGGKAKTKKTDPKKESGNNPYDKGSANWHTHEADHAEKQALASKDKADFKHAITKHKETANKYREDASKHASDGMMVLALAKANMANLHESKAKALANASKSSELPHSDSKPAVTEPAVKPKAATKPAPKAATNAKHEAAKAIVPTTAKEHRAQANAHAYDARQAIKEAQKTNPPDPSLVEKASKALETAKALRSKARTVAKSEKVAQPIAKPKEWESKHYGQWQSGLSKDVPPPSGENGAVTNYTGASYTHINSALRQGKDLGAHADTVKGLDSALAKTRTPEAIKVYRYVGPGVLERMKEGKVFTDPGYMSTTMKPGSFDIDADEMKAVMHINVPKGAKGAAISSISKYPDESEFLLPRGSQLKISQIKSEGGISHVYAELVA